MHPVVTSIGDYAFHACDIQQIEIGDSVTEIGERAFQDCDKIKSVEIPESVVEIKSGAFYFCEGLEDVRILGNLKSIGDSAFEFCGNLEKLNIGDGTKEIEDFAFRGCDKLKYLEIPASVTKIKQDAFCEGDSVIFGHEGSFAQNYALENNIAFCQGTFEQPILTPANISCPQTKTVTADKQNVELGKVVYGMQKLKYASSDTTVISNQGKIIGPGVAIVELSVESDGKYGGCTKKMTVKVGPVKQKTSLKVKGKKLVVSWKRDKKATGYQLEYSTDRSFRKGVKKYNAGKIQ